VTLPVRIPLGLLLAAYGGLVVAGVLPHDSPLAGALAMALGLLLLLPYPSRRPRTAPALQASPLGASPTAAHLVAALGVALVASVLLYNAAAASGLSGPEWALVAYGAALAAASRHLHRRVGRLPVHALVAWSFPLVLAPLAIFALNALLSAGTGETAASPLIRLMLVHPTAAVLAATGTPTALHGSTILVATARGTLALEVGLVCAGLYPMVLFGSFLAMHAWTARLPWRRTLALAAGGLGGLWLLNLVRLAALAKVGIAWGAATLQEAHANLGWLLFGLFMALFWAVALRRPRTAAGQGPHA
jgi:archaeosortase C (PEF-CTERM variant)